MSFGHKLARSARTTNGRGTVERMKSGDRVLVRFQEDRTRELESGGTVTYSADDPGYDGVLVEETETEYVVRLAGSFESVPKAWVTALS